MQNNYYKEKLLSEFHIWIYAQDGSPRLLLNRNDQTAQSRYLFYDLTHQLQNRSNYQNSLNSDSNSLQCNQVIILTSVPDGPTPAFWSNIPRDISIITLFSGGEIVTDSGHNFYQTTIYKNDNGYDIADYFCPYTGGLYQYEDIQYAFQNNW